MAGRAESFGFEADARRVDANSGWVVRFVLVVDDLDSVVSKLEADGVTLLNEVVENQGRKQILCADPSGNVIEFQQPAQESL